LILSGWKSLPRKNTQAYGSIPTNLEWSGTIKDVKVLKYRLQIIKDNIELLCIDKECLIYTILCGRLQPHLKYYTRVEVIDGDKHT
jgi:hypothetical protein